MFITTRIKITLLFTLIVAIIIAVLNTIVIDTADQEWQNKQKKYVTTIMESMYTPDEAKQQFQHLQIISQTGQILHSQGIFSNNELTQKVNYLFFQDKGIFKSKDGNIYYILDEIKDGIILRMAEDCTDIIMTRDMIIEKSISMSLLAIIVVIVIGYVFSYYILFPIRLMCQVSEQFSLENKNHSNKIGIEGNKKDEIVMLALSLESLFDRVRNEASKLEQFSDDIAHEIKNTLFSIQSSLDIALHTEHKELGMQKAKNLLTELSNVVDALLFFSRNEELTPIDTQVNNLIESHIDKSDARIVLIDQSKAIKIPLYPELFMTAIGNIVSNAQKFTPQDGKIIITIFVDGISIRDTGIGISEKHLPHIFNRFYKIDSARSSGSGYGLGLAITEKIIQNLHKMHLSVESKEGKGTTFFIKWKNS